MSDNINNNTPDEKDNYHEVPENEAFGKSIIRLYHAKENEEFIEKFLVNRKNDNIFKNIHRKYQFLTLLKKYRVYILLLIFAFLIYSKYSGESVNKGLLTQIINTDSIMLSKVRYDKSNLKVNIINFNSLSSIQADIVLKFIEIEFCNNCSVYLYSNKTLISKQIKDAYALKNQIINTDKSDIRIFKNLIQCSLDSAYKNNDSIIVFIGDIEIDLDKNINEIENILPLYAPNKLNELVKSKNIKYYFLEKDQKHTYKIIHLNNLLRETLDTLSHRNNKKLNAKIIKY